MAGPPYSPITAGRKAAGFVLPEHVATLNVVMDDGAPIRVVRHGNPSGPRVVLSHGNGFASDSYFPFWRHMLERFDLTLYDVRNCGRNPFHAGEAHDYPRFVRDIAQVHGAIAEEWGEKTTIGVFHSMTAIAALLAIIDGFWHWDALVLFDPPVVPPEGNPRRGPLVSEGETLRDAALGPPEPVPGPRGSCRRFPLAVPVPSSAAGSGGTQCTLGTAPRSRQRRMAAPLSGHSRGGSLYRRRRTGYMAAAQPGGAPALDRRVRSSAGGRAEDCAMLQVILRDIRHRIRLCARYQPPPATRGA